MRLTALYLSDKYKIKIAIGLFILTKNTFIEILKKFRSNGVNLSLKVNSIKIIFAKMIYLGLSLVQRLSVILKNN